MFHKSNLHLLFHQKSGVTKLSLKHQFTLFHQNTTPSGQKVEHHKKPVDKIVPKQAA